MIKINWIEIPVLNIKRAQSFYENVFNLNIELKSIDDLIHGFLNLNGEVNGILFESNEINNGIIIYFHVDRVSEVLEKVIHNNGEILINKTLLKSYNSENQHLIEGTLFDGKTGYFAKIKDTEGNIIGLHSNA